MTQTAPLPDDHLQESPTQPTATPRLPSSSLLPTKLQSLKHRFLGLSLWKRGIVAVLTTGVLFAVSFGGLRAYEMQQKKALQAERPVVASPVPSPQPSPSPEVSPTPTSSASPKPTPSPKPSPSASPSPTVIKTYVLNWSTGRVEIPKNTNYAVYAILKYDGKIVTDQKNVKYTWTITKPELATITPFTGCTQGIQEPCPEDHATIVPKQDGETTIVAKAFWKDTGAFIDDVTIELKIQSPPPSPSPTPQPPVMNISFPTNGQHVSTTDSGQICVVDVPVSGTQGGIYRKHNLNNAGWTSYASVFSLCFAPVAGSNTLELQYRSVSSNLESSVYSVQFTYGN